MSLIAPGVIQLVPIENAVLYRLINNIAEQFFVQKSVTQNKHNMIFLFMLSLILNFLYYSLEDNVFLIKKLQRFLQF